MKFRLPLRLWMYLLVKRMFDFMFSALASTVLLLPMAVIAALIAWKDPGWPLFRHRRLGFHGAPIRVYKFRTMRKGAEQLDSSLSDSQRSEYYAEYKLRDDPRLIGYADPDNCLSCLGGRLRNTCLDELPQILFNILILGNMSVVGPRPILEEELMRFYTPSEQKLLLSVKPGLTGYWQAYAHESAGYNNHRRQEMELYYVRNRSTLFDLKILLKTVQTVLWKAGVQRGE